MSYRGIGGGGYPYKKSEISNKGGYSMNAVPPPSTLINNNRSGGYRNFNSSRNNSNNTNVNSSAVSSVGVSGNTGGNNSGLSKHGYSTMDAISQFANSSQYAIGKRKTRTEDEYFDEDDDQTPELAYIPAPGSPSAEINVCSILYWFVLKFILYLSENLKFSSP